MKAIRLRDKRGAPRSPLSSISRYLSGIVFQLLGLVIVDAFALWFIHHLVIDGNWPMVIVVASITLLINFVFLREDQYPHRWLSPGIALTILMVVYPLVFCVYTAFTNYSNSHLLTKQQVVHLLEREEYLPEGAPIYSWNAFRSSTGEYVICLTDEDRKTLLARPGKQIHEVAPGEAGVGTLDKSGIPQSISGYERLSRTESVKFIHELSELELGVRPNTIIIISIDKAGQFQQRYTYNPLKNSMVDHETGKVYYAVEGTFTSPEGETLRPGFHVTVGLKNFHRLLTSSALQKPLINIFLWTVTFALLAVITTFALGLFLSVMLNYPSIPIRAKKLIRSVLLIPYAIPAFISILIWRGMLNPHIGVINKTLEILFSWSPPWFSNQWWAKIAIIFLVNLWLGFPYMMLISTGALQSIPTELYEAAEVDGASGMQRFWSITLPLLLVIVRPLLIFSFAFNFNNFNVIYLFNKGKPPMPYTATPAGYTDILMSYSYRLAFEGGRGGDYGYAATITIIIFLVLAVITLFQFRYMGIWKEVSKSV